jgi:putative membrane-bound dehydrogenase-like protein
MKAKPNQLRLPASILMGVWLALLASASSAAEAPLVQLGVAKVDITPASPIRLTGYASRRTESEEVEQRLWAKALAIGSDADKPALLLTVDNCGMTEAITEELARRLAKKARIERERLVICVSHTHAGPCLTGWAPNIFAQDVPPEQQAAIDLYTRALIDRLEQVALAALANRQPGRLEWSQGTVGFAKNRRAQNGPVDQALPVLRVVDPEGKVRAVAANYACHCTTLGGEFNRVCGDWAGYAQEALERDQPGAIGLITIGCGADANPAPRGQLDHAKEHGEEIAAEVKRLSAQTFTPIRTKLSAHLKRIELPFAPQFTREQWEARATRAGIVGYHAKKNLARLDRGEKLPEKLPYYVQSWTFGDDLALVFLAGEAVVDYSLRLKQEFDAARLWVSGYANYVPGYIPSRRILQEGGYEAEDSLWYYDRPARLAPETEDLIISAVHELMPKSYLFDLQKAEFPPPKSPADSLAMIRTRADLTVELVAAEPLVIDPVAVDFGADGKLWVVEMRDYPSGLDGKGKPGGRVKVLESTKPDGKFDRATVFLDALPFPTGLMAWRKGVLICAAPDILYAEDTNGDGKADVVKKLYSGFATHNFQARVNGLTWGLDQWVYGAAGLFGGTIRSALTGKEVELSGRDFRIHPDTGEFEPASGLSQQGRVRDDFGNWFGCDNSTLLWHFPMPDDYVRRNPSVAAPDPRVFPPKDADPNQLFPISRTLERFNDPAAANRTTSACGVEIYRDDLLGAEFYGNAFVCEPVHSLVHRLKLSPQGVTFAARRAAEEQRSEFLASSDNWFRPVQARTGPDGALWIVDMYRFVIEHPRWIPPERLAKLDVRAGDDKGRIYRVYPRGKSLRPVRDLTKLSPLQLVSRLETPNGPTRDLAHRLLIEQQPDSPAGGSKRKADWPAVRRELQRLASQARLAAVRVQALCVLDGWSKLLPENLVQALADDQPEVRRQAVRLSESYLSESSDPGDASFKEIESALLKLVNDPEVGVRNQLALSLGNWHDPRAGQALGQLAQTDDPWVRAAVLSSATRQPAEILKTVLAWPGDRYTPAELIGQLMATAAGGQDPAELEDIICAVAPTDGRQAGAADWIVLASLLDTLERRQTRLDSYLASARPDVRSAASRLNDTLAAARKLAASGTADAAQKEAAVPLLGRGPDAESDLPQLAGFLKSETNPRLQHAALEVLRRQRSPRVPALLLAEWPRQSPALRAQVVGVLLGRDEWIIDLLGAVKQGVLAVGEIPLAQQQRLLKHDQAKIKQLAGTLFHHSDNRVEVLARYQSIAGMKGDAAKGAAVFAVNCASCHAFGGQGHAVGPDLGGFRDKSVQDFLVAILDPNAAIEPRFVSYSVETKDGRSLTGIIRAETATSLTLAQGGGVEEKILRGDIEEIKAGNLSLMPEGLEQNMAPSDLADLIAYLRKASPQ